MSQKSKCRKFFQQLQPTFSIDVPRHNATKLEFLDHSDPSRDIVVRKKAREWVNRNKEIQKKRRESQLQMKEESAVKEESRDIVKKEPESVIKTEEFTMLAEPQQIVSMSAVDPFNILPSRTMVGRKYDHIIQFFFHGCPEEIPCSDDKYSDKAKNALIPFSRDNTVLGNMANSDATFILWLYATVTIRDGMKGNVDTEEVQYYYNKSLKVLQDTLKKETDAGVYSDHLLNCMACITATASFAGMFKTAELHRDALVRVLGLRGNGDAVKGLSTAVPWTIKALQWCEIMVATQLVELPKIPYIAQTATTAPPKAVVAEAALATSKSLINLPSLSAAFHNIFHLMHHLGIAYSKLRREEKIDDYIIQPLYDVECALLQVLEAQKQPGHGFTEVEVLLAEALQLYFWTGPRMLPPQTRLCDLLVSRTMRALLPLLLENVPDMHATYTSETAASILDSMSKWNTRAYLHPRTTNNAIAWSLAVGTVVSASLDRPEHCWFKEHLRLQLKFLGLDKDEKEFLKLLDIFPTTEGFSWIKLTNLFGDIAASKI